MSFFRFVLPLAAVAILLMSLLSRDKPQNSRYGGRMLALEFAQSQYEVDNLVENGGPETRNRLNRQLEEDTRFIIPAYWICFVFVNAFLVANSRLNRRSVLGVTSALVPVVISIAAVADLHENVFASASLLHNTGADLIYPAAMIKWTGIAAACVVLGLGFLMVKHNVWSILAALAYLSTGVVMSIALLHWTPWVQTAGALLLISIGMTGPAIYASRSSIGMSQKAGLKGRKTGQ